VRPYPSALAPSALIRARARLSSVSVGEADTAPASALAPAPATFTFSDNCRERNGALQQGRRQQALERRLDVPESERDASACIRRHHAFALAPVSDVPA